jgi:uncharacterized protein
MENEWDEQKRKKTLKDRGVDFADFDLLHWDSALTLPDTRNEYGETRYITLGYINDRLHVAVWCYRGSNTRVISLRKANRREVKKYEGTFTD